MKVILVLFKKILKDYGTAMQTLENEVNLKTKNEIDTNYLKSLRYSVSLTLSLFKH